MTSQILSVSPKQLHKSLVNGNAMSKQVITTDPVSDIRRVAQAMQEYNLTAIPVADEQDKLVGIVSRGDVLRAIINNPPLTIWS